MREIEISMDCNVYPSILPGKNNTLVLGGSNFISTYEPQNTPVDTF